MDSSSIYKSVQDHYGSLALANIPSNSGAIAQAFGYTEEELNKILVTPTSASALAARSQ